ncbi:TlpA family protein disulfide reductase [Asticcacaulis excentricus]|uniref:Alkyl hydroperoxide reductase/ Thiol specific antioxidant/ Mal allergen n=1 Tax=Asticcacaulis excentricus (strain ATCC 15261 / DSM 4724 / KCTC 12464 / NCIMB 9791 / VKM B-1370 / CB 48) TaxID=573065 RepID=E8RQL3_ASTEC|nr:TlpA disulfide reductase family protein [Asticcacaulis excentricus]ADU12197.1 alkyl hydroperoxide reductase/ Thiol specific antioxidant/ Mal allergen [Asticcacaulis excentricus CB 48]
MNEPLDENTDTANAEAKAPQTERTKPPRKLKFNLIVAGLLVLIIAVSVAAVVLFRQAETDGTVAAESGPVAEGPLKSYATGALAKLETHATARPIEDISFLDGEGKPVKLSDFKGRVVVLNVWATWCAPCKVEMPTLANLQKGYDPQKVLVLPLSIDKAEDKAAVEKELKLSGGLPVYIDSEIQPMSKWGIVGMPTTIILDKNGQEVARLSGEAKWDAAEVKALVDALAK